ncbi:hypothetical protein G8S49_01520 [Clostridium botulinum C]|uniref:Lipoprotein n=2 Tax=Clostridium botulinum TaxID=1491 RepID=A0A9Q4TFR8_CLOBO|nr:hypothetical protein [Clostridium botulinum]EGO87390.1 hypothetical protein CBCST_12227 [Clostridium botulinum C str. Stockholm]MCD3194254.1 hypothetical protein [Clostridium botulinum C]MCD3199117.1 hypothetical protein [Clostridium botulinum C]MCD3204592.1 hypothetical protein [Clostridium botulinum C]MCD3207935.1 hypothetical protein [Clostridium botulinum C]
MKKIFIAVLSVIMAMSLAACEKKKEVVKNNDKVNQKQEVKKEEKIDNGTNVKQVKKEDIKPLFKIEEVKNKSEKYINYLLGQPKEKEETSWHSKNSSENIKCFANIYEKNNYDIEILFIDKIAARITITPKDKINYPEENENLLKSLGISPVQCDFENSLKTEWKNKYGVYNFTINALGKNINFIYIILDQKYE